MRVMQLSQIDKAQSRTFATLTHNKSIRAQHYSAGTLEIARLIPFLIPGAAFRTGTNVVRRPRYEFFFALELCDSIIFIR